MASVARSARRRRQLEDWKTIPWKRIQRDAFRLQQRNLRERCAFLSRTTRRIQASPQPTTTAASQPVSPLPGGKTGNAGKSRQAYSRDGWYSVIETQTTAKAGQETEEPIGLEGSTDSEETHPQARIERMAQARDSCYGGPSDASPGQASARTGMGSQVRTQLVWVPTRTLGPRCDRSDLQRYLPQAQVCLGCRHREMLRQNIARSFAAQAERNPTDNAVSQSVAQSWHCRRRRDDLPRRRRTARGCDLTVVVQCGAARPGRSNQPGCATEAQSNRDPLCRRSGAPRGAICAWCKSTHHRS
jgi:hypothetical protein